MLTLVFCEEAMLFTPKIPRFLQAFSAHFFAESLCIACHVPFLPPASKYSLTPQHFFCGACLKGFFSQASRVCALCGMTLVSLPRTHPIIQPELNYEISFSEAERTAPKICLQCIKKPPPWDGLGFYAPYGGLLQQLIVQYKYRNNSSLIPVFSHFLYEVSKTLPSCHVLIPMPRHTKRLVAQGYNQMVELCRVLEKKLCVPMDMHALYRTRYTLPQAALRRQERHINPIKSFAAKHVLGKNVLLVDDVMTTGATLHHAALALRNAGAVQIFVALLARAEK